MRLTYRFRLVLVIAGMVAVIVLALLARGYMIPPSFGLYGPYRGDAVMEEADRDIRHGTNASCLTCHPYEASIHLNGRHKTISCEFCHGTWADHITNGKKTGTLPVKTGQEITILCLRCHNKAVEARPSQVIKTVTLPDHLEKQSVKLTHTCNQCHHVHAPLLYINRARQITGLMEATHGN
ncbi:MAG: hypothetical protein V1793_00045 [Pseudomonadota bacterium]